MSGKVAYCFSKMKYGTEEEPCLVLVMMVTDLEYFQKEGYQSDATPDGTHEKLAEMGYHNLGESMESVIEIGEDKDVDKQKLEAGLQQSGFFVRDEGFTKLMRNVMMPEPVF